MFTEWGFLLGEIWVLLLLATLLGLLGGWIIWGGSDNDTLNLQGELDRCRSNLAKCNAEQGEKTTAINKLKSELDACKKASISAATANVGKKVRPSPVKAAPAIEGDYDGDGVNEGTDEGKKPTTLTAARSGKPDDLKKIKGVGPKLEKLLNDLGFYHFDQVASWTADEVAWVDANLQGFKGRVSRDNWISQAKLLAAGGETEFSKKVDKGSVY